MSVAGSHVERQSSRSRLLACLVAALASLVACGGSPSSPTSTNAIPGFTLSGDPASASGATWVFRSDVGGVHYDLQGVLLKPQGSGSFPAVVISHGLGGSADGYASRVARVMVGWGLVCIATNYTHAGGVPIGSPGT